MMNLNKKSLKILGCLTAFILMPSCGPQEMLAIGGYQAYNALTKDAELLERNYAAADYLVGRTRDFVSTKDLIIPSAFINEEYPDADAPEFGVVMAEQIALRFAQLGYNVQLPNAETSKKLSPSQLKNSIALKGSYKPEGYFLTDGDVKVTARMIDNSDGRIIETFSYYVPLTYNVSRSVDPPKPEKTVVGNGASAVNESSGVNAVQVKAVPVKPVVEQPVIAPKIDETATVKVAPAKTTPAFIKPAVEPPAAVIPNVKKTVITVEEPSGSTIIIPSQSPASAEIDMPVKLSPNP